MRILFITRQIPHERSIGGHAIIYRRIRKLHELGHEIGLVTYTEPEDEPYLDTVRPYLSDYAGQPLHRRTHVSFQVVRSLMGGVPPPFAAYSHPDMRRRVGDMVDRGRYDIALAEFSEMGQFLYRNPHLPAVRKIVSIHKCATIVTRKKLEYKKYRLTAWRERLGFDVLQRYEFDLYGSMDRVFVLTAQERNELLGYSLSAPVSVIPSGVDVNYFEPGARHENDKPNILFTGNYSDPPNREAAQWFLQRVWPWLKSRRPDVTFYVVGPNPSADMLEFSRRDEQVALTGKVEDIRPYLQRASVFVCPMRTGSGLQGKVLEAMSCRVPVVSTSIGVEGLMARNGHNCLIADRSGIMAQHIDLLLSDEPLREKLAQNAHETAEQYSWAHSIELLEQALNDVLRG